MSKITINDPEGVLTRKERAGIRKWETAKKVSGWSRYPTTCDRIFDRIPPDRVRIEILTDTNCIQPLPRFGGAFFLPPPASCLSGRQSPRQRHPAAGDSLFFAVDFAGTRVPELGVKVPPVDAAQVNHLPGVPVLPVLFLSPRPVLAAPVMARRGPHRAPLARRHPHPAASTVSGLPLIAQ